ncbi:MAG TPA: carboxypeptidase regulatory-like domain-containing protein [Thermoanaerobaculia bacterium]|nr:carboxypeptidase regulatory-like domain-containing protein [Thermoanaerobaculia bacterium]
MTKRAHRLSCALFLVLLILPFAAFSQGLTGSLTGTVTQDNSPLPGVTITISSPQMQGTRTAVSNEAGGYNFGALPPGDYTVQFELQGMQTQKQTAHVGVAQTARADAAMKVSSVTEAITVTAAAPAVAETTEVQTNFGHDAIEQLPIGRTITAITGLAPGVVSGVNGFAISGGQSFDNLYTVDGAVVQENLRGQPHNLFIEDAIQETTIQTAGISAEFGNFTGGVVTAITKSGGNQFSGSLRDSLTNPNWTAKSPDVYSTVNGVVQTVPTPDPIDKISHQYEGTLGGRVIRDRLWFFAAGRYVKSSSTRSLASAGGAYTRQDTDKRKEGKLTGAITQQHSIVISMIDAPTSHTNDCQLGCFDMSSVTPSVSNPNRFKTGFYNGVFTSSFLVEAKATDKTFAFVNFGGTDHDRVTGTPVRLTAPGFGSVTNEPFFCGDCRQEDRNSKEYGLKATYFLGTRALGNHTIVGGLDRWHETLASDNYQTPSGYVMILGSLAPSRDTSHNTLVNVKGGTSGDQIQYWPIFEPTKGSDLNTDAAYVNDKWDFNNQWQFNVGFRFDKNDASDSTGNPVANDSKLSPRLGVGYDVFGTGKLRLNASYASYVGRLADGNVSEAGSVAGVPARFNHRYQGPDLLNMSPEAAMTAIWAWFDQQGGIDKTPVVNQSVPGATTVIDGSLKSPGVKEWSLGASTQIGTKGFLRLDYIKRDWKDFYTNFTNLQTGTTTLPSGAKADLTKVRTSNEFSRNYNAVEVQAQYRLTRAFNVGGNYTWSRLRGNYTGETSGSGPVPSGAPNTVYPEYNNFAQSSPIGPITGSDQTHKARAWAGYDFQTFLGTFNLSALERFDSGGAYSLSGSVDIRQNANFYGTGKAGGVVNPGYQTPPTSVGVFFSGRGQYRFPNITNTDLALNYNSNPGWLKGAMFFVQTELINAFNEHGIVSYNTSVLTHLNDSTLQRFNPMAGDTPVEGVNWKKGPLFGKPTAVTTSATNGSYQLPRTYRVSAGIRF